MNLQSLKKGNQQQIQKKAAPIQIPSLGLKLEKSD